MLAAHRFKILLAALSLLLLVAPFTKLVAAQWFAELLILAATMVILASAAFAVTSHRRERAVVIVLMVLTVCAWGASQIIENPTTAVAQTLVGIAAMGFVVALVLGRLFSSQNVTLDTVAASVCVYLLLGVIWALAYTILYVLQEDAFIYAYQTDDAKPVLHYGGDASNFALYYSFVTMTTLGYGDVVPASEASRTLATTQAIVGQLYLTVLVARLVGMHIAQSRLSDEE